MFDVDVRLGFFDRVLRRRVAGMFPAAEKAFESQGKAFRKWFASQRLSGRKAGNKGLYKRTGNLRNAFEYRVAGDRLDRLRLRVGWWQRREAMIAGVHEYGAVIRGRPWLVFRLLGPRGKDYGWKKVRQVRIPARLELRKKWREWLPQIKKSAAQAIREVARRG